MCCNPESPFWRQFRPFLEPLESLIAMSGIEPPTDADGSWCEVANDPEPDANADPGEMPLEDDPPTEDNAPLEDDPGDYPGDYPPPPPPLDPVPPGPAGPA